MGHEHRCIPGSTQERCRQPHCHHAARKPPACALSPRVPATCACPAHLQRVCEFVQVYAQLITCVRPQHVCCCQLLSHLARQLLAEPTLQQAAAAAAAAAAAEGTEAAQRQHEKSMCRLKACCVITRQLTSTKCCLPYARQRLVLCTPTISSSPPGTPQQQLFQLSYKHYVSSAHQHRLNAVTANRSATRTTTH
jgi:hypothetical protein